MRLCPVVRCSACVNRVVGDLFSPFMIGQIEEDMLNCTWKIRNFDWKACFMAPN